MDKHVIYDDEYMDKKTNIHSNKKKCWQICCDLYMLPRCCLCYSLWNNRDEKIKQYPKD